MTEINEIIRENKNRTISLPLIFLIAAISAAFSVGINWGIYSTENAWMSSRITALERAQIREIQRPEYDASRADIIERLARIEKKLDEIDLKDYSK